MLGKIWIFSAHASCPLWLVWGTISPLFLAVLKWKLVKRRFTVSSDFLNWFGFATSGCKTCLKAVATIRRGGVDKFKLTPETEELLRGISSALQDAPASSSSQSTCCIALKPFFRLLFSCTLITGYLPKNSKIKDLKCILLFVILVLESKGKKKIDSNQKLNLV